MSHAIILPFNPFSHSARLSELCVLYLPISDGPLRPIVSHSQQCRAPLFWLFELGFIFLFSDMLSLLRVLQSFSASSIHPLKQYLCFNGRRAHWEPLAQALSNNASPFVLFRLCSSLSRCLLSPYVVMREGTRIYPRWIDLITCVARPLVVGIVMSSTC